MTSKSYPLAWSQQTYNAFLKSYGRATKIFQKIANFRDDYPIQLLRFHQVKWERFKKIVKTIDKWDREMFPDTQPPYTKHLYSLLEDFLAEEGLYPVWHQGNVLDSTRQTELDLGRTSL